MSKLRQSFVRGVLAAVTGLANVTVLPQAAPAAPLAAAPPTLAQARLPARPGPMAMTGDGDLVIGYSGAVARLRPPPQ